MTFIKKGWKDWVCSEPDSFAKFNLWIVIVDKFFLIKDSRLIEVKRMRKLEKSLFCTFLRNNGSKQCHENIAKWLGERRWNTSTQF